MTGVQTCSSDLVVVVKKHIADNDLSATYRSLVVGIVGVIDEKSIE